MPPPSLSLLGQQLLPLLYQHRLVATGQLHRLCTPHTARPVYLRRELGRLRQLGLAAATERRASRAGRPELLWFCTARGAELVEHAREVTPRLYRISPEVAASQLQEHTLAVVETGTQMVEWARRLGDECGPLDWEPELAHRIRDGERRGEDSLLIPDSVLRYTHVVRDGEHRARRRMLTFFVEVDRGTMQMSRLARKVTAYARYASYVPSPGTVRRRSAGRGHEAWRDRYPAFPRLLIVLTEPAAAAARRIDDLRALASADLRLRQVRDLAVGVTTLEQLASTGPFTPIVTPVLGPSASMNVLMTPASPIQEAA